MKNKPMLIEYLHSLSILAHEMATNLEKMDIGQDDLDDYVGDIDFDMEQIKKIIAENAQ